MLRHPGLIPLSKDHHQALALCVMTDRELAGSSGAQTPAILVSRLLRKFDEEILEHFEFEEQVLFPALAGAPELSQLIAELRLEHIRMIEMTDKLRCNADWATVKDFTRVLRDHVRKEESVLFEQAQQILSAGQLIAIGSKRQKT